MLSAVPETSHSSLLAAFLLYFTIAATIFQLQLDVRNQVKAAYFFPLSTSFPATLFFFSSYSEIAFLQTIWKNWFTLCPSLGVMRFLPEKSFHVSLIFCSVWNLFQTGNSIRDKALVSPGLLCCTVEVTYIYLNVCMFEHECMNVHEISQSENNLWVDRIPNIRFFPGAVQCSD